MTQVTEPRTVSAQPNIQDLFLNHSRRERLSVRVHLGRRAPLRRPYQELRSLRPLVDVGGTDQLVFKHAIATIAAERSVADDVSSHHP